MAALPPHPEREVPDEGDRALLMAVPLRHLQSAVTVPGAPVLLPAGGPGDADSMQAGAPVLVIATEAGEADVPAVTWHARFVRRVPYLEGDPWPDAAPSSWTAEHVPLVVTETVGPAGEDADAEEWDAEEWDEWDDDAPGPQSFVEVTELAPLPRPEWVFANELVRKQARRGRSFLPRVPVAVHLPE